MSDKNISDKQLKIARWYLDNRQKIRKKALTVIIIVGAIAWLIALWQLVIYLTSTEVYEKMMSGFANNEINYTETHERLKPNDLIISNPILLNLGASTELAQRIKYDLGVLVENPNTNWRLDSISYYFVWDGGQSEIKKSFIMPKEKKYLLVLGQETEEKISNPQLVISDFGWQRIKSTDNEKLEILPLLLAGDGNLNYIYPKDGIKAVPKISFQIKNKSVHGFWQVNFIIILKNGKKQVGFNVSTAKSWQSGEERQIETLWPDIPTHDSIEIETEVNVFDDTNFLSNL
jgi:hypothetical protein